MSGPNPPAGGAPPVHALSLTALMPLAGKLGLTAEQMPDESQALAAMTSKIEELMPLASAGRAHLDARRQECLRLAGLGAPENKVPEHLTTMVGTASLEAVEALIAQFGGKAAASLGAVCPHCQKEVPIRSSLEAQTPAQGDDKYVQAGLRMAKSLGKEGR